MYFFSLVVLGSPAIIHQDLGKTERAVIIFMVWVKLNSIFGLLFYPTIVRKNLIIIGYNHGVICIIDAAFLHRL